MMTEQQRKVILNNLILGVLNRDRCDKRYDCIQKLWEASGATNKDLVDELMSNRENAAEDFKDSIFWDMIWVLKEKIVVDKALRELFSDLYGRRFHKIDKYIKNIEKAISEGKIISLGIKEFKNFYKRDSLDEALYYCFRIYHSDPIVLNDCIDEEFWSHEHKYASGFMDREIQIADESIKFTDDGNEVFKSKRFERFVDKQKQALAEYLEVEVGNLSKMYDKVMTIEEDTATESIGFHSSGFGLINVAAFEMIWLHGGASRWLVNVQSLDRKNKLGYRYRPDFNELFKRYCKASIRIDYMDFMVTAGEFTPMMLASECSFIDMEALAQSIGHLYVSDCIYQMYLQMQKQYYENFSWENYHNKDLKERYEDVIEDLKNVVSRKESQLDNLHFLYGSLKQSLEKKNDLALINEMQEKEKLVHICEDKDSEIIKLKEIIATQNHMITQLQCVPVESVEDNLERFDTDKENIVFQKKYLFVGDITALGFEDLKKRFPSSVFMNTNTVDLSHVQVDAIVYLIQAMGHSMYYKCKNTPALRDVKAIYFNGRRNLLSLLETIEREIQF